MVGPGRNQAYVVGLEGPVGIVERLTAVEEKAAKVGVALPAYHCGNRKCRRSRNAGGPDEPCACDCAKCWAADTHDDEDMKR